MERVGLLRCVGGCCPDSAKVDTTGVEVLEERALDGVGRASETWPISVLVTTFKSSRLVVSLDFEAGLPVPLSPESVVPG